MISPGITKTMYSIPCSSLIREPSAPPKTEQRLYPEVEAEIRAAHSYEEPEILAIPVLAGSPGYLAWVGENLRP